MYTLLALLGLLPLSAIAAPAGNGIMDVGSPEWLKKLQDGMFLKKDEPFCKANVAIIKALLKDHSGTNYCSNVLNLPATTLTETVFVTPSAVSAGMFPAITDPAASVDPATITGAADPAATSSSNVPAVSSSSPDDPATSSDAAAAPTTSSGAADPATSSGAADPTTSAPQTSMTSTTTKMETISVDVTVTIPVIQTETTTTTITSQNLLTCLSTAITGKPKATAAGPGAGVGASAALDLPPLPTIPVTEPPFGFGKRASDPKYGLKPVCIPDLWDDAEIQEACKCLALPPPSCTTTVTAASFPRPTAAPKIPVAGAALNGLDGKAGGTGGLGGVSGILGGILRRLNGLGNDDNERCSTVTSTATATNTVTATSVSTTTKVETAYATATSIVPNGLDYKNYTHPFDATDRTDSNPFTSAFFKKRAPIAQGTLGGLSFATPNWPSSEGFTATGGGRISIPGLAGEIENTLDTAFLIQAFFIATMTGDYTFSSDGGKIDNWGMLWLGEPAYCDWDDANAAFLASRTETGGAVGGTTTLTLTEGDAVPLTWLWANGGGAARSHFSLRLPDGTVVDEGDMSAYFVRACNDGVFV